MSFEERGRRDHADWVRARWGERMRVPEDEGEHEPERNARGLERSLAVGAQTLAGIGLGLLTVIVGAAIAGLALETLVVPGLLVKLAGGVAGGGIGMARGIHGRRARGPNRPGHGRWE